MTSQATTQISSQIITEPISKKANAKSTVTILTDKKNISKENQEKNLTFMVISISSLFMIGFD